MTLDTSSTSKSIRVQHPFNCSGLNLESENTVGLKEELKLEKRMAAKYPATVWGNNEQLVNRIHPLLFRPVLTERL